MTGCRDVPVTSSRPTIDRTVTSATSGVCLITSANVVGAVSALVFCALGGGVDSRLQPARSSSEREIVFTEEATYGPEAEDFNPYC